MKLREGRFKLRETLLLSLGILAVGFGFQRFWVVPKTKSLDELGKQVDSARKQLDETRAMIAKVGSRAPASTTPVVADDHVARGLLDRYLESNDRFSKVVMGIVSGSKEGSFTISKILAEKSQKMGAYTQTLYELETESSFLSIGKFLESLEDSPLLTEVESVEISRIEQEMKRCTAKIRLYGYVGEGK